MPNPPTSRAIKGSALTQSQADLGVGLLQISQTTHGFDVGDVIYESAVDTYAKARADSESTFLNGLAIVFDKADADNFTPLSSSLSHAVTLTSHGFGSFGQALWLSAGTAGLITATEPASGFTIRLGYVLDANTIRWEPGLTS